MIIEDAIELLAGGRISIADAASALLGLEESKILQKVDKQQRAGKEPTLFLHKMDRKSDYPMKHPYLIGVGHKLRQKAYTTGETAKHHERRARALRSDDKGPSPGGTGGYRRPITQQERVRDDAEAARHEHAARGFRRAESLLARGRDEVETEVEKRTSPLSHRRGRQS